MITPTLSNIPVRFAALVKVPCHGKRQPRLGAAKVARGIFHLFTIAVWVFLFFAWAEIAGRYAEVLR